MRDSPIVIEHVGDDEAAVVNPAFAAARPAWSDLVGKESHRVADALRGRKVR